MHPLRSLSRQSGTTLPVILAAAFAAQLSLLSGQDDVVLGFAVSDRERRECEPLIGCFVNTLPLRVRTGGSPTFLELLAQVRQVVIEAYARGPLPFTLGQSPSFQAMFEWEPAAPSWDLPGVTVTPIETGSLISKCDLTLSIAEQGAGLRAVLEYRSDLFDRQTIVRWSREFQSLLTAVARKEEPFISRQPSSPSGSLST